MLDVSGRVAAEEVLRARGLRLDEAGDRREQDGEPVRRLGMVPGGVETGEIWVAYDVDGLSRSATTFMPQLRRREDASAHVGVWSAREGSGAEASSRAIRR